MENNFYIHGCKLSICYILTTENTQFYPSFYEIGTYVYICIHVSFRIEYSDALGFFLISVKRIFFRHRIRFFLNCHYSFLEHLSYQSYLKQLFIYSFLFIHTYNLKLQLYD